MLEQKKLKISTAFITQSYFTVPKDITLKCTCFSFFRIWNKRELQQTAFNHLSDVKYKNFINLYKKEQAKFPYSPLGKALEKPTKTIEGQEKKETETLKF